MSARKSESAVNWPRRLNRLLIGVGVVAFGLIIGDRLMHVLRSDHETIPQTTAIDRDSSGSAEVAAVSEVQQTAADNSGTPIERDETTTDTGSEFGSQLVFVSLSEPKYVVTADRQRYYVGSAIDEHTVLAGVADNQVIIDRDGTLTTIELRDSLNQ